MKKQYANRAMCPWCHRVFCKEKDDQEFCSEVCKIRESGESKRLGYYRGDQRSCKKCGQTLPESKQLCESCKKSNKDKSKNYKDSIIKENEKWLNGKNNSKKNKVPLSVIEKKLEYQRVFDDSGWDHYLKGRKWDRI